MAKKTKSEQHEELIETLKFTPRTYRVSLTGYGGEIVIGSVARETYEYFRDNEIDVEEYAGGGWDWEEDEDHPEIPEEHRFVEPGNYYDCDDVAHESGCEFSDHNYITITDENGNEVLSCRLSYDELEKHGIEVEYSDEYMCSDRSDTENTVGFIGQSVEKGTFFDGDLDLTAPLDLTKLKIYVSDLEGWELISGVTYNDEDIEGMDGYDTRGKSMEMKFWDTGDED